MPPASQTDVGWIPKEVKKKLKEQKKAEQAAAEADVQKKRLTRRARRPEGYGLGWPLTLPEGDLQTRLKRYLEGFATGMGWRSPRSREPGTDRDRAEDLTGGADDRAERLGVLHLSFITVVDRVGSFELTYELLDLRGGQVRVKTKVEGEEPVIDSVTGIYPTANWHEREAYDMFGVAFKGHPDLRRLYMWQDHFDHHPLLKSFEISTKRTFENLR